MGPSQFLFLDITGLARQDTDKRCPKRYTHMEN